jgi:hypothetical protein
MIKWRMLRCIRNVGQMGNEEYVQNFNSWSVTTCPVIYFLTILSFSVRSRVCKWIEGFLVYEGRDHISSPQTE